ncbi:MAG: hypothetical protein CENE_01532 [Candidatus Celerinatantimonas neptuna]|nr:MAG: hypothetical protein CENE_01532 [Candidatus Celerinatantimonas neptuna]
MRQAKGLSTACNTQDILHLRQLQFENSNIAVFGLANSKGQLKCTSWGHYSGLRQFPYQHNRVEEMAIYGPMTLMTVQKKVMLLSWGISKRDVLYAWLPLEQLKKILSSHLQIALLNSQTLAPLLQQKGKTDHIHLATTDLAHHPLPIRHPVQGTAEHLDHQFFYYAAPLTSLKQITLYISQDLEPKSVISYLGLISISSSILCFIIGAMSTHYVQRHLNNRKHILKRALKHHEFINYFQPIYNTQENCLEGIEVLVRWQPSEGDLVTPIHFLHEIIHYRLINALLEVQLKQLPTQLSTIIKKSPKLKINVNVLAHQLTIPHILRLLINIQQHLGTLVIELTEQEMIEKHPEIERNLFILRQAGVQIAIDDFGTGYSSLSYLQRFPIDIIKIDQMFIADMGTETARPPVLRSIIHLGKLLKIHIVAEGVETIEQSKILKNLGVFSQQGWFFSQPMSIEQLNQFKHT